jgi:hypothetical protein
MNINKIIKNKLGKNKLGKNLIYLIKHLFYES